MCHFQFLGRLYAKSIIDAHLIDLNLSPIFSYWLLGLENHITPSDFFYVDNFYQKSVNAYLEFHEKVLVAMDEILGEPERNERIEGQVFAISLIQGGMEEVRTIIGSWMTLSTCKQQQ